MRTGIKLGPRAAAFVAVLIAASAVGILTPTLSNTVSKDVQVTGFAVTLTVDGIPDSVAPGGVFRVVATMSNNANRPTPAVLRNGRLREPGELELGRLDAHDRFLRTVRGLWRTVARWIPRGSEPPIPRELPVQALGRATGRPRNPAPPVHLWAALNRGPSLFLFSRINRNGHNLISRMGMTAPWNSRRSSTFGFTKASTTSA